MPIVITIPDSRLTGFSEPAIEQAHASVQDYVDALMGEIDRYEQIKRLPASGRPEITGAIVKDATLLLQRGLGTKPIGWLSAMMTKGIRIVAALLSLFVGMMYDAAQLQNQQYLFWFILLITLTVLFNILSVLRE